MKCRRETNVWLPLPTMLIAALFAVPRPIVWAAADPPAPENTSNDDLSLREDLGASLFDGRTLDGWQTLDAHSFKRHGEVTVEDGRIALAAGAPATGIRYAGDVPRIDYELSFEAMRVEGNDFFCGLTFPVGQAPCTLIVGGWGGGVVGLSNVDGRHAEENETMKYRPFENGRWYRVRLRVTAERIAAWIDDEQLVDLATADRKFTIWWEQEPAAPLGIATWHTSAAFRDIRLTRLEEVPAGDGWVSMFDGRSLAGWKQSEFGTAAAVEATDGRIVIHFTDGCNGVTWQEEFPTRNYEIALEAMRVDGIDFFCGLTFPVGDDPCSLIVGGWGGAVVGLSSLDGQDAARNETRRVMAFKTGQWYRIRLRVTEERIAAWIDDEQVVDVATAGRKISIRPEVNRSRPLGIASWCTTAAVRGVKYRELPAE